MRPFPTTALLRGMALATVTGGLVAFAAPPASAAPGYPVTYTLAGGIARSLPNPAASPAGVNIAGCQLTAAHPRPVVLVNGTFTNMIDDWAGIGPRLANLGYCVYATPIGGLQNVCPFNWTDHANLTYDRGVFSLVRNALDPAHPAPIYCF